MRPELLNPIFAEVTALKGIGPQLARPVERLGLEKLVDILFHLPVGHVDRIPIEALDAAYAGRVVSVELTPIDYRASGGRGPFRIWAQDKAGNMIALVYFWRKSGLGEEAIAAG